jgi:branched-chain amino acid transport system permease protein
MLTLIMDNVFIQILINGLIAGSIYALIASGFSLIYSTNKFVHFAHGGVIIFAAYFLFWLYMMLGVNLYFASALTVIFASALGYILNKFFYAPLRNKKAGFAVLLIASVAILILLESLALIAFGASVRTITLPFNNQSIHFGLFFITPLQIGIIFMAILLSLGLWLFTNNTKIGKAMRAVSDNKDMAKILGIPADVIFSKSFILGSGIAGVAAILIAMEQNITPVMGTSLIIKGFTSAVIGGVGSLPGSMLGALLLGLSENFGIWFLPSGFKDAIAFTILFAFLLFMPQGILGKK